MRQQAKKTWSSNIRHTRQGEDQLRYSYMDIPTEHHSPILNMKI